LFRLRHSSVSGFPVRALVVACRSTRPTPPSSNRTCGFPASGSPGSSRLGHSPRISLPWLGRSTQPRPQKGEAFRSRAYAQAVLLSSRLRHASSKAPSLHGHYPVSSLLWASPTPAQVRLPVMSSLGRLAPERASQVPVPNSFGPDLSAHAVPFHPGEPNGCFFSFLHRWCWLHLIR
jgi:hypothetical protein